MKLKKILAALAVGALTFTTQPFNSSIVNAANDEAVSPFDVDTITVSSTGGSSGKQNLPTAKSGQYRSDNEYDVDTNKTFTINGRQVRFDPQKHGFYKCVYCGEERITEIVNKYRMSSERPYTNPPSVSSVCPDHNSDVERNHSDFGNRHEWIWVSGVYPVRQEFADYMCADCNYRVKVSIGANGEVHPPHLGPVSCTVKHDTVGRTEHNWFRIPIIRTTNKYHEATTAY